MQQTVLVVASAFLAFIAYHDFRTLKIRNVFVLILIGIYAVYSLVTGFATLPQDLIAGVVLFVMAFIFWMIGLVGAGDAKLYFPVGLFLGLPGLVPYLVLLIVFSIIILVVVRVGGRMATGKTRLGARLKELRETGRIPYSVPMSAATIVVLIYKSLYMPL